MRNARFVWTLLCLVSAAASARADVIVEGTVEYWDEIAGSFVPARHVTVEVERDWAIDDPEVQTDDKGYYHVALPNPSWGTHDGVDIEVYAETTGLSQIYYSIFDFWPYHVTSRSYDDVPGDSKLRIDLRFGRAPGASGAPSNLNLQSWEAQSSVDTAKAFVVHAEMYEHYRQLKTRNWHDDDFGEKEVIVPAFGKVSYYNHVTNFINLVTGDWLGLDWAPLPKHANSCVAFNSFRYTVRHEYSHAIHDEITVLAPIGLNMPSYHSPYEESNPWIAWTEGFADFLALVTIGRTDHAWEFSRGDAGGLPVLQGNHIRMEGEVTGFLWDLYDAKGYEALRHPARRSADGVHALPISLVRAQMFYDALEDPTAAKIRQVASMPTLMGFESLSGSVETLTHFIQRYAVIFPAPHEVKTIALNRDVPVPVREDYPAVLTGSSAIRRWAGTVTLDVVVREDDPEDRPFVRLTLYQQLADGSVRSLAGLTNQVLSTGWKGAERPVQAKATLRPGFRPGDVLWLEVNDDILPRVYRFTVPLKDGGIVTAAVTNERLGGPHDLLPPGILALVDVPPLEESATVPVTDAKTTVARDREDFEAPLDGHWTLRGNARVERAKSNRTLLASGFGLGVWDALDREVTGVRFKYRHGVGVGDVITSMADASRRPSAYHLLLFADRITLTCERRGVLEELASEPFTLESGRWVDMTLSRSAGEIRVSIDGLEVLRTKDTARLLAGKVAFGALVGTGFAFDDIVFFSAVVTTTAPASPTAVPLPVEPSRRGDVTRRQELGALLRAARRELRAYGDLVRRRERIDRALYRLARSRDSLPKAVDLEKVFPRRKAVAAPAVATLAPAERAAPAVAALAPAERAAHGAYVRWMEEPARRRALAKSLNAAQKTTIAAVLADLRTRTIRRRAAEARVADLRRRLQAAATTFEARGADAPARTRKTLDALVQALEKVETDSTLLAALARQQTVLETLGR